MVLLLISSLNLPPPAVLGGVHFWKATGQRSWNEEHSFNIPTGGNSEFEINTKYRLGLGGHKHLFSVKLCNTKNMSLYLVPLVIWRVASCEGVDAFSLTFTPSTAGSDTSWTSGNTENQRNSCIFRKTHILEFPSVMLCVSIKNMKKKSLDRLWWTQGREDHSFRLGTEYWFCALLWAALGADGPSWCLLGGCHGNLKLGSPAALVDDRNPLNLFLHSVLLFVYLQVSFPLDTHLPSPHKPTLTGAGTPPSAWKRETKSATLASRGNRVPLFAF